MSPEPWLFGLVLLAQATAPAPLEPAPAAASPAASPTAAGERPRAVQEAGAPVPKALVLDRRLDESEIRAALDLLATAGGERARLGSLGRTRGGRDIPLLTLSDPAGGPPERKPAILVLEDGEGASSPGAEAILALGEALLARTDEDGSGDVLARCTVHLAPMLQPDSRVPAPADTGVRFDRNFPLGWWPASLRPGSGNYPLSEPETLALAEFLAAHDNLTVVVAFRSGSSDGADPWGPRPAAADRRVVEELLARVDPGPASSRWQLVAWGEHSPVAGGPLAYAYGARGVFPLAWMPPSDPEGEGTPSFARTVSSLARRTADLVEELPRVSLRREDVQQVAPGLWQLDLALSNVGGLPTLSELCSQRHGSGGLELVLEGAELLATAEKLRPDGDYQVLQMCEGTDRATWRGAALGAGETRWLRLILRAESQGGVSLSATTERGGEASLVVLLAEPPG